MIMIITNENCGTTLSEREVRPRSFRVKTKTAFVEGKPVGCLSLDRTIRDAGSENWWASTDPRLVARRALLKRFYQAIEAFGDNWDGQGGQAPATLAIDAAAQFLEHAPAAGASPTTTASTEGGVMLEWETDEVELLLYFARDGSVSTAIEFEGQELEGPVSAHVPEFQRAWALLMGRS